MDGTLARKAILLTMAIFFLQPLGVGAWFALIPHVKESIGLSKSELAVALLGMPLAVLVSLQIAGRVVGEIGLRKTMRVGFAAQGVAAVLPLLAQSQGTLFLALALFGFSVAFLEVGFNAYAGRLETTSGRLIMNRCHGFWALGLMAGSLIVALTAGTVMPVFLIAIVSGLSCLAGALGVFGLPQVGTSDGEGRMRRRRLAEVPRALAFIGAFMFLMTLTEGAMADWSAIYLAERAPELGAGAGLAVSVFAGFMAAGRFVGDALKRMLGAVRLARVSVGLAAAGVACLVLPLPVSAAFVGFALVGVGVAACYPLGISAASGFDEAHQTANVALLSTAALAGFLVGPPLFGFLGEAIGLRLAFAALLPGLSLCIWLASRLHPAEDAPVIAVAVAATGDDSLYRSGASRESRGGES